MGALLDPRALAGFGLYGLSSLCWLGVLSSWPLSRAYPVLALNFVLVALLSRFALGEELSSLRLAAAVLCCLGVALLGVGR